MNAIEHLESCAWKKPDSYGGFSPDGDYCILSLTRDSDVLAESNWAVAGKSLNAQAYDDGRYGEVSADRPNVYHWRASHWAVGWVEYLMVRADAPESVLEQAGEIVCSLADYPILNETDYSEREWNAGCDYWEHCSVSERVDYLQRAGLSIFAARRDTLPEDDNGYLFGILREGF